MTDKARRWRLVRELVFTIVLASFFARLAYNFLLDFQNTGRLSSLFYVLFEFVNIIMTFSRRVPTAVSWNPLDWGLALLATVLPLWFIAAPSQNDWFWFCVQCIGQAISMLGMFSLNRSLGIVPANRGVKTRGMYRFVRHPIYCGYTIIDVAMLAQNFCTWNILIAAGHQVFQVWRILREERFLLQDPLYAEYAARVKWRMLPIIW